VFFVQFAALRDSGLTVPIRETGKKKQGCATSSSLFARGRQGGAFPVFFFFFLSSLFLAFVGDLRSRCLVKMRLLLVLLAAASVFASLEDDNIEEDVSAATARVDNFVRQVERRARKYRVRATKWLKHQANQQNQFFHDELNRVGERVGRFLGEEHTEEEQRAYQMTESARAAKAKADVQRGIHDAELDVLAGTTQAEKDLEIGLKEATTDMYRGIEEAKQERDVHSAKASSSASPLLFLSDSCARWICCAACAAPLSTSFAACASRATTIARGSTRRAAISALRTRLLTATWPSSDDRYKSKKINPDRLSTRPCTSTTGTCAASGDLCRGLTSFF
jgi:hypothetical protein